MCSGPSRGMPRTLLMLARRAPTGGGPVGGGVSTPDSHMDLGLTGRVALVTGASRGLGLYIARALAAEGCHQLLAARGDGALAAAADGIAAEHGVRAETLAGDIADPAFAERLADAARDRFGRLDILIGNAGTNRRKPFGETTDADWTEVAEVNTFAHLRTARAVLPLLAASDAASILFTASIFGREAGGAGLSLYNATKSALISAAKVMAYDLAPQGIRVNTIAPGSIRFPGSSWDRRVLDDPDGMAAFVAANIPLGRFGTAEEVASAAAFLVSARASLITGACLNIDGGQSKSLI